MFVADNSETLFNIYYEHRVACLDIILPIAERQQLQMTVVRGEAIGETVYDHFPRLTTIANGATQIVFGVLLFALSLIYKWQRPHCHVRGFSTDDDELAAFDASLWVWIDNHVVHLIVYSIAHR
jgi:hypothetical protein